MKKAFLILAISGISTMSFAQAVQMNTAATSKKEATKTKLSAEQKADKWMAKFQAKISGLSAQQTSSIKAILVKGINDGRASNKDMNVIQVIAGDAETKIKNVLSASQKSEFSELMTKLRSNYQANHPGTKM